MMPLHFRPPFAVSPGKYRLLNFVGFQSAWLLLVWFREQALLPAFLLLTLMWVLQPDPGRYHRVVLGIAAAGMVMDSLLSFAGLFAFGELLIPLWLCLLWLCFALALPYAFAFMQSLPRVVQALCGLPAALSYLAGERFGAVGFPLGLLPTVLILSLIWAVFLLVAVHMIQQQNTNIHKEIRS